MVLTAKGVDPASVTTEVREHMTTVTTISRTGFVLGPLHIYKGTSASTLPKTDLLQGSAECAQIAFTCRRHFAGFRSAPLLRMPCFGVDVVAKAWMNRATFHAWLKMFVACVKPTADRWALVIVDNHDSRFNSAMLADAIDNHVAILTLPPNCTHILQPCDVGIYGTYKSLAHKAVDAFTCDPDHPEQRINRSNLVAVLTPAWEAAVSPQRVIKAWEQTGIDVVCNRKAIPPAMLRTERTDESGVVLVDTLEKPRYIVPEKFADVFVVPKVERKEKAKPKVGKNGVVKLQHASRILTKRAFVTFLKEREARIAANKAKKGKGRAAGKRKAGGKRGGRAGGKAKKSSKGRGRKRQLSGSEPDLPDAAPVAESGKEAKRSTARSGAAPRKKRRADAQQTGEETMQDDTPRRRSGGKGGRRPTRGGRSEAASDDTAGLMEESAALPEHKQDSDDGMDLDSGGSGAWSSNSANGSGGGSEGKAERTEGSASGSREKKDELSSDAAESGTDSPEVPTSSVSWDSCCCRVPMSTGTAMATRRLRLSGKRPTMLVLLRLMLERMVCLVFSQSQAIVWLWRLLDWPTAAGGLLRQWRQTTMSRRMMFRCIGG